MERESLTESVLPQAVSVPVRASARARAMKSLFILYPPDEKTIGGSIRRVVCPGFSPAVPEMSGET